MPKLKRRADGRYVKNVIDPKTGKRKSLYGKTERELNRNLLAFYERLEHGRSFADVADDWWDDTEPRLSPNTIHGYDVAMRRAVEAFGEFPIGDITTRDIQQFIKMFAGHGAAQFARKTVSNQLLIIRQIFAWAVDEGEIDTNPATAVKLPKGLKSGKRTAASAEDEDIIKQTPDLWLLPYFILYTGLRKGEALALTGADIDLENRTIKVTKSVYFDSNIPYIKEPKTEAGTRTVPILAPLLPYMPKDLKEDEYLFPSSKSPKQPMARSLYMIRMGQYHKATGTTFGVHQLRHSYASILYECGIDPKTAQALLGHADIETTLGIYTDFSHAADENRMRAAEKLDKALAVDEDKKS